MEKFAVIDTETNWIDQVMSIGCCIAQAERFVPIDSKYHVLLPEIRIGGMYEGSLYIDTPVSPIICSIEEAAQELCTWLHAQGVHDIFAYNANFDRAHLPQLGIFRWHDIMRLAAYRQSNPKIPPTADCFATGRLKRGYGVEAMLQLLSGDRSYRETHNALRDALDELRLMQLLGHAPSDYPEL